VRIALVLIHCQTKQIHQPPCVTLWVDSRSVDPRQRLSPYLVVRVDTHLRRLVDQRRDPTHGTEERAF
jgi:hypothetical protein